MTRRLSLFLLILCLPVMAWGAEFGVDSTSVTYITCEGNPKGLVASPSSDGTLDSTKVYLNVSSGLANYVKGWIATFVSVGDTLWFVDSLGAMEPPTSTTQWNTLHFALGSNIYADTTYIIAYNANESGFRKDIKVAKDASPGWTYVFDNSYSFANDWPAFSYGEYSATSNTWMATVVYYTVTATSTPQIIIIGGITDKMKEELCDSSDPSLWPAILAH